MALVPELDAVYNITISTGGGVINYAEFQNNTTPGVVQPVATSPASTILSFSGVVGGGTSPPTLAGGGTQIVINNTGVYKVLFSIQYRQGGTNPTLEVWFTLNGVNIPNSASEQITQSNSNGIITVEFIFSLSAGNILCLLANSSGNNTGILTLPPTATAPQSPAIVLTIMRIA